MTRPLGTVLGVYSVVICACFLVQFSLGADVLLLVSLSAIALLGTTVMLRKRLYPSHFLLFILTLYLSGLAVIIKTLLLQPVDQNLSNVGESTIVLVLFATAAFVAFFLAHQVRRTLRFRPIFFRELSNLEFVRFLARWGFSIGFALHVLHFVLRPQYVDGTSNTTEGFGGLGEFYSLMLLGFVAQLYLLSVKPSPRAAAVAMLMFFCFVFSAFAGNIKKDILDAGLVVGLAVVAFGLRLRVSVVISGAVLALFVVFVAAPLIHITRSVGTTDVFARIEAIGQILAENDYDIARINAKNDNVARGYEYSYSEAGSYVYPSTANLDRFALILPIDQVTRVNDPGRVPYSEIIRQAAESILPSFLVSKSAAAVTDVVAWEYGFRRYGNIARPVVGLPASSYAMGGLFGVVAVGLLSIFVLYLVVDAIAGPLAGSILAVGTVAYMVQMAEKEADIILTVMLRSFPIMLLSLFAMTVAYRWITGRRAAPPVAVGRSAT